MKKTILLKLAMTLLVTGLASAVYAADSEAVAPIAYAGLPRYAAQDPIILDGTGSYDPDSSGTLSYAWRQIDGPSVVIIDANTATPTVSGFVQTDAIRVCEFEIVVSDGEMTSLPDTVIVIIVPDFGDNILQQENPPFDPDKPTLIYFGGGNCWTGNRTTLDSPAWAEKANVINFPKYAPDPGGGLSTYYRYGDMIIVYLSSVAPDYKQPIQTSGFSTGGQPAIDAGIRLNLTYVDARYAVNRVTFLDATRYCRDYPNSISQFLDSSVDAEQCWIDNYAHNSTSPPIFNHPNLLSAEARLSHKDVRNWFINSLTGSDMNQFNNGIVAGAYWSVIGPGKNLQLASTPDAQTYKFQWYGDASSGYMDFYDKPNHPGRLPEPVTLLAWSDALDPNGAVLTCQESENAVGYQLLFGPDPHRVMDYDIISDTPAPPNEVITTLPFEETWWTVRVRDQYGSTIYADPMPINALISSLPIENMTTGIRYSHIQDAIDDAATGDEIVVKEGIYRENIDFKGKNLTIRSIDTTVVGAAVINGSNLSPVVTFSNGEDPNCVLAGFTITGGNRGILCSGSSPTISNCIITGNSVDTVGGGINCEYNSNPNIWNCTISDNSAIVGGAIGGSNNSNPVLTNCILWGNMSDEIFVFGGAAMITHSDIQGGYVGEGNIDADPLFADPANGDYHLKSQAGRWDPVSEIWVIDEITSPCIDTGDPNDPIGLEPEPNGGIINMGAYGGTVEASKSP